MHTQYARSTHEMHWSGEFLSLFGIGYKKFPLLKSTREGNVIKLIIYKYCRALDTNSLPGPAAKPILIKSFA